MTGFHKRTVLVTGASSGIGAAFARRFAQQGANLILVARSVDRLEALAAELRSTHSVAVTVVPADLGAPGAAQHIYNTVTARGLNVDVLVNNAGFGSHGRFEELDAEREHQQIQVNVTALVDLTHAFVPAMLQRGNGTVINIASTVAFQPVPFMAVYGASKAFVTSFSAALAEEYRGRGLKVLAVCPGATDTNFFDAVGNDNVAMGQKRTPDQVVTTALQALERGQSVVIDGAGNRWLSVLAKRLSFGFAAGIAARITRRALPDGSATVVPGARSASH
jgi:uncharacterized protein